MKLSHGAWLLLAFPLQIWAGYSTDPQSGLYFNDTKYTWAEPANAKIYHGVKTALLLSPEDIPERNHYSNSNMARLELHDVAPGGGVQPYLIDDFREQVFVILKGEVDFSAGGKTLHAKPEDMVFIPPGVLRGFTASGNASARILQAEWVQKGPRPPAKRGAFVTSEHLRGMAKDGGDGYVTVVPNPRQLGIPLSILTAGADHINLMNGLLLYPADMTEAQPFKANTQLAMAEIDAYYPGGGTVWHFHPDQEQAFVILSGGALFEIGPNTVQVKSGDIVFAPRFIGHGYMVTGNEPLRYFQIVWQRLP